MMQLRRSTKIGLGAGLAWLVYSLSLDLRYRRFPEVTIGAVEIAAVVAALLVLTRGSWLGVRRLLRRYSQNGGRGSV